MGSVSAVPGYAAPSPGGVAAPPRLVFSEAFENGTAAASTRLAQYTGASGETFSADPYWLLHDNCNGVIVSYDSRFSADDCTREDAAASRVNVQRLADVLGQVAAGVVGGTDDTSPVNGSTATTRANHAVTEWTTSASGGPDLIELQTRPLHLQIPSSRFLNLSVDAAEASCAYLGGVNHSRLDVYLGLAAGPTKVNADPVQPCSDPGTRAYASDCLTVGTRCWVNGGDAVRAGRFFLDRGRLVTPAEAASLQVTVRNRTGVSEGNDHALDNVLIYDATPQLDTAFSPTTITQGASSTLTFTVTNTSELGAKNGWSFRDDLPAGLVASGPVGGTCALTDHSVTGDSISASGNLAQGQVSCTITVQVTSDAPGAYTNSGCTDDAGAEIPNCTNNVSTIVGLYPPGSAPLTVLPEVDLSIAKSADLASYTPGLPITYTVTVRNAGPSDAVNATFTDPIAPAVTNAQWTCAVTTAGTATLPPTGGTACGGAAGSGSLAQTVRINVGGTLTYTVRGIVAPGTTGPVTNEATIVPAERTTIAVMPGGGPDPSQGSTTAVPTVDEDCPPAPGVGCSASATTPGSSIGVTKGIVAVTDADNDHLTDTGDVIHYRIVTTNTGGSTLSNVTVTDVLAPPAGPALTPSCTPSLPATLAPGDTVTCTADYVITAQDVRAGKVDNRVTSTGTPPDGPSVTSTDTATQPTQTPVTGLSLVKSAAITKDANNDRLAGVGDEISYTFHLTNTGNVTLEHPEVDDEKLEALGITVTCPSTTLSPGQEMDCTADVYVTTQADIDAGLVRNVATASATSPPAGGDEPPGTVKSPPSKVDVPTPRDPDPSGALAFTGSTVMPLGVLGVLLLLAGLVMARVTRRRPTPQAPPPADAG